MSQGELTATVRARRTDRPGTGRAAGMIAVTGLLAAGAIAWAAVPMSGAHRGAEPVLIAAICCAALALVQLALRPPEQDESALFAPLVVRAWWRLTGTARSAPWADGVVVAVLGLAALHRSPAWHTALAGVVLLAYLFGTHLAETGQRPASLRPQLPLIVAGLALLAVVTAVTALPAGTGAAAAWLRVLAVAAAVIIAALAVPV